MLVSHYEALMGLDGGNSDTDTGHKYKTKDQSL